MSNHLQIFDVQHGSCALLTSTQGSDTWRIMIDCGHKANDRGYWFPGDYLRSQGITALDLLIISNLDEDHVSGLPNLLSNGIAISTIFSNPSVSPGAIRQLKAQYGMGNGIDAVVSELSRRGHPTHLPLPTAVPIYCAWNIYPTAFDDENNLSVVTSLDLDGWRFLFTGDIECAGFDYLLAAHAPIRDRIRGVDVLVAPHHGRASGICPDLFNVYGCAPKLVVMSDDYVQYDSQRTSSFYRSKASGHLFKGDTRYVLTTRDDGTLDFLTGFGSLFVY